MGQPHDVRYGFCNPQFKAVMLLTMADTYSLNSTKSHGNKFFAMSITKIARDGKS